MKFRFLALATVASFLFFPSTGHADSIDQFVLTGPASNGYVYTWTWEAPSSPIFNPEHVAPGIMGWFGISVMTEAPPTGSEILDYGVGHITSHDLFFYGVTNAFSLTCNSACNQWVSPIFGTDLWTGSIESPTFLLGNFVTLDGKMQLTVTRVPEAPEMLMIALTTLALVAIGRRRFGGTA